MTSAVFSLQQGKHITAGEGGLCTTNDPELARRIYLFINKAWGYGDPQPDHYFLAPNYRMSELQGAVALAQLDKLDGVVSARRDMADKLTSCIVDLPGIQTPKTTPGSTHSYWKYPLRVDGSVLPGGSVALGDRLREAGIACMPRYIQKPAYKCAVISKQVTFGRSRFPFNLARREATDYSDALFPGTLEALRDVLVLPWNERYTEVEVARIADALSTAVRDMIPTQTPASASA